MISGSDRLPTQIDGVGGGVEGWFAREAPSIVAGLEAAQFIGPVTAATAWRLIAAGNATEAVELVLEEVDESWRQ
ncbi:MULTISPECIES: harpin-binding protein [Haloferax]|uniref:Harpin-binding protein n=1 Tax=Haloferax marinum TaxID=2666143 RepID=A0A6A8GAM8_9EURY|nr:MULTISPECIES: harpin-binding protein [Haloferax]KAB1191173.1 harpin-binding protein [Haloferax sp. CBA1150]MRW98061.1 harpin-binding protein [Haloferax marinum]